MTTPLALTPMRRYLRHGTLLQLAALEAVVRLGSATRAAQALCVAQPTISGHLRKLADALGVRLFELEGKRLVPTAAALVLLEASRDVAEAFARCEATLGAQRERAQAPPDGVDNDGCGAPRSQPVPPRRACSPGAPPPAPIPATTSSRSTTIPA